MNKASYILFMCNKNAIRSPMAEAIFNEFFRNEAYCDSVGVDAKDTETDGFAIAAMEEIGIDISSHRPKDIKELEDHSYDLIIALTPEAYKQALELARHHAVEVEYWETPDPSLYEGMREMKLEEYRKLRTQIYRRIMQRFADFEGASSPHHKNFFSPT